MNIHYNQLHRPKRFWVPKKSQQATAEIIMRLLKQQCFLAGFFYAADRRRLLQNKHRNAMTTVFLFSLPSAAPVINRRLLGVVFPLTSASIRSCQIEIKFFAVSTLKKRKRAKKTHNKKICESSLCDCFQTKNMYAEVVAQSKSKWNVLSKQQAIKWKCKKVCVYFSFFHFANALNSNPIICLFASYTFYRLRSTSSLLQHSVGASIPLSLRNYKK